ncbi:formate/nitrite transporter protein [Toxoplasma gondii ME49]|uniref:Formate-nitrite transporter 3 n=2 Tax=Toxoplasma gondii TaxID=5811 RepID=FNT3_TOXGM|nr:formate/nitrite transporter protein [Toxoplasma gondii ME49]EPT29115.1 formate/nitrite transporter protein [Toxoplasma gondii ME49]ESS35528.1 formate/nitrite transporter protein [Toxoplasma gondii VEG]|eukprot:XP_018636916.1 formate/nitrite transporter protein [Toxoplasma gondii ME49]
MVLAASPEAYRKVIEYGIKKTKLRIDRLFLQAIMAGIYVGMAGHACTALAGAYSTDPANPLAVSKATQKFLYASLFPVAFIAIIFTGAELFTGNTMTMLVCLLERRVTALQLCINWICSLVGNWAGALFAAYFLSYLPGVLQDPDHLHYLEDVAAHKTELSFLQCFCLAVGCNTFVCLAVWFVIASDDAAGKIMSMWFPIVSFCVAGYEHIIANFYTLQCALMHGVGPGVGTVILKNFIPTLLGNIVGGCGLVGAVYWYNFYPTVCVVQEARQPLPLSENAPSSTRQVVADLFSLWGRESSTPGVSASPPDAATNAGCSALDPPRNALLAAGKNFGNLSAGDRGALAEGIPGGACEDCLLVPRASFGGEYHPPQQGDAGRWCKPSKAAVGSGGVLCHVQSPAALEAVSNSPLRENSGVPSGGLLLCEGRVRRSSREREPERGGEEEGASPEEDHPAVTLSIPPTDFHPHVPREVEQSSLLEETRVAAENSALEEHPASTI